MPGSRIELKPIEEPWLGFLRAVDAALMQPAQIHCIGGFALLLLLEGARPTGDVDFVDVVPDEAIDDLLRLAGRDSKLAAEHRLFVQAVKVIVPPTDYESRLLDATPAGFRKLGIELLDPCDLVLTKLERNFPRDREDARALISQLELDGGVLRKRFDEELKPYLAVAPETTIRTFDLWMDEFYG